MMFTEPHTAFLTTVSRDKYNAVSGSADVAFACMIEEGTQFLYESGQPMATGRGRVFTSSDLSFVEGEKIKINDRTWLIRQVFLRMDDGMAHHTEIIYG